MANQSKPYRYNGYRDVESQYLGVELTYRYHGAVFDVLVTDEPRTGMSSKSSSKDDIGVKMLWEYEDASYYAPGDDDEPEKEARQKEIMDALRDLVGDTCLPLFRDIAPVDQEEPPALQTVGSILYEKTYNLQALTVDGSFTAIRRHDVPIRDRHPPFSQAELDAASSLVQLPRLNVDSIYIVAPLLNWTFKVLVEGTELVAKITAGSGPWALTRELEIYHLIHQAGFDKSVRVPQLKGFVESHTGIIGLLMHYIDSARRLGGLGGILGHIDADTNVEISLERRQKWARQIQHTVEQIHTKGILWEDVKTDNVLIDANDDAWVIDFGGGRTAGWTDADLFGTREGDLQGLRKILQQLGVESS